MSKSEGQSSGLVDIHSDNVFIMRADSDTVATGRGRDSIRIESKDQFADVSEKCFFLFKAKANAYPIGRLRP